MHCIPIHEGHRKRAALLADARITDEVAIDTVLTIAVERGLNARALETLKHSSSSKRWQSGTVRPKKCDVCGRSVKRLNRESPGGGTLEQTVDYTEKRIVIACSDCRKKLRDF